MGRLDACATKLQRWNQEIFGHVGREITQLEQNLKTHPDALSCKQLLQQIWECRKKEEIMWWQRARSGYLQYGDSNTQWFHSRENMRTTMNFINHLVDDQQIKHTKMEDIEDIIVNYFSELFTTTPSLAMEEVLDCVEPWVTNDMDDVLC